MAEPTDAELWQLHMQMPGVHKNPIDFARAVLAKWGAPAQKTNQCGEVCERAKLCAICAGGLEDTQPQAGAVPLTDGQAKEVLWSEHLRWMQAAGLDTEGMRPTGEWLDHWLTYVRAIERAHGIGIKGGQHG